MPPTHLKVFIGSPSDVEDDRKAAVRIINGIQNTAAFKGRVTLSVFTYDDGDAPTAMPATIDPQSGISKFGERPSGADFTIILLWSRIGTRLPPSAVRDDGRLYESGTEWELEDARRAGKDAFVYVRQDPPPRAVAERSDAAEQLEKRNRFLDSFRNADGSSKGFVHQYQDPPGLKDVLEKHMEGVVRRLVERAERSRTMRQLAVLAALVLVAAGAYVVSDLRAQNLIESAHRPEVSFKWAGGCWFAAGEEKRKGFLTIDYRVTNARDTTAVYLAMATDQAFSNPYLRLPLQSKAPASPLMVDFNFAGTDGDVRRSWARIEVDDGSKEKVVSPPRKLTCTRDWQ